MAQVIHEGYIEINGDGNDVELTQRGNTDTQFADIVLDDGHDVNVFQRYGEIANIDLTNAGGAYTLDPSDPNSKYKHKPIILQELALIPMAVV